MSWGDVSLDSHSGCYLLEQTAATPRELRGFVERWIDEAYFRTHTDNKTLAEWLDDSQSDDNARAERLFPLLQRFRLLTMVRDGGWGCDV